MAKKQAAKQAAPAETLEPQIVEGENPDHALVQTDGAQIFQFLRNMAAFFRTAREMEMDAKAKLVAAKELKPPKNADEDSKIQTFIKARAAEKKVAEDHWSISAVFFSVNRKLTAARSKTTVPLDEAARIAQTLHNDYADAERRRIAREQEERRREDERKAQEERDRELAALEEERLKLEAESPELSEREAAAVDFYVLDIYRMSSQGNMVEAARRANFKNPDRQAAILLASPKVQAAIEAKRQAELLRKQAASRAAAPLDVRTTPAPRPDIGKAAGGSFDRTTHGAEVLDEEALLMAVLDPVQRTKLGIPLDVLQINRSKVNEHGKELQERINLWPGVRHTKKTKTI